jgi:hypothetical protein
MKEPPDAAGQFAAASDGHRTSRERHAFGSKCRNHPERFNAASAARQQIKRCHVFDLGSSSL